MGFFSSSKDDRRHKGKGSSAPETEVDVSINIGTSGAKSASRDLSKKYDYEKIRSEVDLSMIKRMLRVLDNVDTKTQFFTQLEDDGIPLITLVALGITTEEAINSYHTLRARGLDTYNADTSRGQRVDDEYANEIQVQVEEVPTLKLLDGVELDEPVSATDLYRTEVKARLDVERQLREAQKTIKRLEEEPVQEPTYEETVRNQVVDLDDWGDVEEEELSEDDKLSDGEYVGWSSRFDKIKEKLLQEKDSEDSEEDEGNALILDSDKDDEDSEYSAVKSVHKVRKSERKDKEIFVLSEPFEVPNNLKGYKIVFIKEPNDLVLFTASKDNLLVITRAIPSQLIEMFIEWIGSVASKGVKIRAVTLKGLEIEHAFIEEVIEITQESLDEYYEQNKMSKYIGTGVDTFFDIEKSIDSMMS